MGFGLAGDGTISKYNRLAWIRSWTMNVDVLLIVSIIFISGSRRGS